MKDKMSNFLNSFKTYLKYFLLVVLVISLLSVVGLVYIYRAFIYDNSLVSYFDLFNKNTELPSEKITNKVVNEESVVIDVIESNRESVVSIIYLEDIFEDEGTPVGSGVVVSSDGLIITNKHVIEDAEASYEVVLQDGVKHKVIEIVKDKSKDLALVKINATNLKPAKLGDSKNIKLGQKAIAVGNALGFSNTVSVGIVSGLAREVEIEGELFKNLIQTDAAINPGNSGGALLNSNGDLVGINTAKSTYAENIGFAIPVNSVIEILEKYNSGELNKNSVPAFLGVGFVFRDLKDYVNKGIPIGPVITGVLKKSPADSAGIKVGDIIVSIDGVEFSDEYELSDFIKNKNPGDEVQIKVYRKNQTIELRAVLTENKN